MLEIDLTFRKPKPVSAAGIALREPQRKPAKCLHQFRRTLGEKDRQNRMYEVVVRERVRGGQMLADDRPELLGQQAP